MTVVDVAATSPTEGCTAVGCGTQDTVTLDSRHGRRCLAHPPEFDPAAAVAVAMSGHPATALLYCAADLPMPREACA